MTFYTINTTQKVTFPLVKTTTTGQPIDATPAPLYSLESGPTDPATLSPSADGFELTVSSGTVPGDNIILCEAFSGRVPISGEITVTVVPKPELGELVFGDGVIAPK